MGIARVPKATQKDMASGATHRRGLVTSFLINKKALAVILHSAHDWGITHKDFAHTNTMLVVYGKFDARCMRPAHLPVCVSSKLKLSRYDHVQQSSQYAA